MRMMSLVKRFWCKVEVYGEDDCWIWTGSRNSEGYGRIGVRGVNTKASRVSWEIAHGPIPINMDVLHTCDNPPCVNPKHLVLGTATDNIKDAQRKGRWVTCPGERNGRAKLTIAQVQEIKKSPLSKTELAIQYGVSRWAIENIRHGKSWKEVHDN